MTLLAIDSRKRVSLTKVLGKSKSTLFDASVNENGEITLKPLATIPENEKWVWEKPELVEQIRRGIADAEAGRTVSYNKIR